MRLFLSAFQCEWLKRKRSAAALLVLGGSLFTPGIVTLARLLRYSTLPALYSGDAFWKNLWFASWESMAIFFLPMTAILTTSLVTQIEFKSNAWKQVHALPMSAAVLYLSKLAVILVMMIQLLALFSAGVYASGIGPGLLVPGVPAPKGTFFSLPVLRDSTLYFVDILPIVAAQYAIGLRTSNMFIPLGIGFMAWVGALGTISTRFAIWWPYSYTTINYVKDTAKGARFAAHTELHALAVLFFLVFTAAGYWLFITRKDKG